MEIIKTTTGTRKKTAIKKSSIMLKMRAKIKQKLKQKFKKKMKHTFRCQLTLHVCQSGQIKFFAKKFVWIVEQKSYDIMNA